MMEREHPCMQFESIGDGEERGRAAPILATILPDWTSVAEIFGAPKGSLFPEEKALVRSAVEKRRAEFEAGRTCARSALAALGIPPHPILCGAGREPVWPDGIVGSITHCEGYCAAAVARSEHNRWLGIDAEPNRPLSAGLIDEVASPQEIEDAAFLAGTVRNWDRLLFSAKESIYKAWYPIQKTWLDFKDVSLAFSPMNSSFEVKFVSAEMSWFEDREARFCGRFLSTPTHLLTSAVVTAADRREPGVH